VTFRTTGTFATGVFATGAAAGVGRAARAETGAFLAVAVVRLAATLRADRRFVEALMTGRAFAALAAGLVLFLLFLGVCLTRARDVAFRATAARRGRERAGFRRLDAARFAAARAAGFARRDRAVRADFRAATRRAARAGFFLAIAYSFRCGSFRLPAMRSG
jgi:hypothetical protein